MQFLIREATISKLVASDIREDGAIKLNMSLVSANQMGYYPETEFVRINLLDDISKNAEIIARINPKCILNCKSFNIKDVDAVATEQLAKVKELLAKYHKKIPQAV